MDVAKTNHEPASKKRKQETAETPSTEFWNARFAWRGTTPTTHGRDAGLLCSSCQSLLIRPACKPTSQRGMILTNQELVIHQSLSKASNAATNGCIICNMLIAARDTNPLDGFNLALHWDNTPSRFHRIRVAHVKNSCLINLVDDDIGIVLKDEDEDNTSNYTIPLHTNSDRCRSIAMRWFVNCLTCHTKCREHRSATDWLPTRLIDVGLPGDCQQPRLILTSELKIRSDNSYVTLSHCWGSTHVVKLESSNISSFRERIPLESLSSNFLDAIGVTRSLGVRYLWIDSLCIMQDSLADWQAESAEMGAIYGNCVCNIAAAGSSDNGGGLFQERKPHWVTSNKVRIQYEGHDENYFASIHDPWGRWISRSELNRRGWVLQERLLSPRTLHFASQLFWECRMLHACETYPEGMPGGDDRYTEDDGNELPISLKNWHEECEEKGFWINVVETYVRCSITKPDDRLIAIAGIAKSLQPILHDEYLAGLWKNDLPYNLVWSLANDRPKLSDRYRCPSWSWAALDYTSASIFDLLIYADCRVEALVSVLEVNIEPLESDAFGPLRGGYLRLTGRIGHIFSDLDREGEWIDGHYSFETILDLGWSSIDEDSLYCLPLFASKQNPGPENWPTIIDCLLLKQLKPGTFEFTRVGLLKVSLDLEDTLPQEIRWIVEHANSNPDARDLVTVTIF